jgi:hypothetical protein
MLPVSATTKLNGLKIVMQKDAPISLSRITWYHYYREKETYEIFYFFEIQITEWSTILIEIYSLKLSMKVSVHQNQIV